MRKRAGFTIVELLVVICVISILLGIVVSAAIGALRSSRQHEMQAMQVVLEQGINAYYAQEGKWPDVIENRASGNEAYDAETLSSSDSDAVFRQVVGKGFGKGGGRASPLLDATVLFVCDSSRVGNGGDGCNDNHRNCDELKTYCAGRGCTHGVKFSEATAPGGDHRIALDQMSFGYRGEIEGLFRRYWVRYNGKADTVSVVTKSPKL